MQNDVTFVGAPLAFKLLALHLHGLVEQAVDDGLVTGRHVDDAHAMDRETVQPITCTECSYHTNHPQNAVITQTVRTTQLSHKPLLSEVVTLVTVHSQVLSNAQGITEYHPFEISPQMRLNHIALAFPPCRNCVLNTGAVFKIKIISVYTRLLVLSEELLCVKKKKKKKRQNFHRTINCQQLFNYHFSYFS